jgi:hypothetical protein
MLGTALGQVGLEGPTNGDKMTQNIFSWSGRRSNSKAGAWMSTLAAAALTADRIDYWIRRHVIQYWHEAHTFQYKLSPAQDKRIGPSAIGQRPKQQYGACATPMPPHLAAVRQLETQKQE